MCPYEEPQKPVVAGTGVEVTESETAYTVAAKPSEIVHQNLSGAGTKTHGVIDAHIDAMIAQDILNVAHIAATSAHGTTSAIVGKDDIQTLKNKKLEATTTTIMSELNNLALWKFYTGQPTAPTTGTRIIDVSAIAPGQILYLKAGTMLSDSGAAALSSKIFDTDGLGSTANFFASNQGGGCALYIETKPAGYSAQLGLEPWHKLVFRNSDWDYIADVDHIFPDSTGIVIQDTAVQSMSNKTITAAKLDNYADYEEQASSPASPSAGWVRTYAKTDGKIYRKTSAGVETELGGSGGSVDDTAYDATSWNGVTGTAPSKNAVRDKLDAMDTTIAGKEPALTGGTSAQYFKGDKTLGTFATDAKAAAVDNTAYNATSWNGVTDQAPSKDAVRDKLDAMDTSIAAKEPTVAAGTTSQYYRGDKTWRDLGTDAVLRAWNVVKRVTTNRTTTVITAADVTDLAFTMGANEKWSAEFFIQIGCSGTGGVKFGLNIPTGATMRAVIIGMAASATAVNSAVITADDTLTTAVFNNANLATGWARVTVTVNNGANAGDCQLRFASTTNGQTSTVFADSYLKADRIS